MIVTQKITIDLARRGVPPRVDAMQGDANTRKVEVTLLENAVSWPVQDGTTVAIAFMKPDGTSGLYDQLPDNSNAAVFSNNVVTITLAPQVLTAYGEVSAAVIFYDSNMDAIATFPFLIFVERNPGAGRQVSNNYYYFTSFDAINQAINKVNSCKVTATEKEDGVQLQICNESISGGVSVTPVFIKHGEKGDKGDPGAVQTVNGIAPDENGNVEIQTGGGSGQNLSLDTTLTQSGKAADAKAVGDALDELEKKIPSISGYATEQYVKEYSQPKGDYLTNEDKTELEQKFDNVSWNNLKDKPFGEETIVLYEDPEFWIDAEGYGSAEVGSNFLETGETYEVEFNGKQYTCVCTEQPYGNQVVRSIVGDDFTISQSDLDNDITVSCDAEVIYNVFVPLKISKVFIKQLDSKYLPEQLQFGNEETVVLYENNAFELYDDDEGNGLNTYDIESKLLSIGYTYEVEINGTRYTGVCEDISTDNDGTNLQICGLPNDMTVGTFFSKGGQKWMIEVWCQGLADTTISVKISQINIKKLDSKYLPDVSDIPASWIAALKTALGI